MRSAMPALLRLLVVLPLLALAQEGCGELEGQVKQLQNQNAELTQQLEGMKQKLGQLESGKTAAEQQAATQEKEKKEALDAVEALKLQIGGHEASKVEALQAREALQQELASQKEASAQAAKAFEDLQQQAAVHEETAKALSATCAASEEMPYLSTDVFHKVFGILSEAASAGYGSIKEQYPDLDAQLNSMAWAVTNVSMEQVQAAASVQIEALRKQVAELSSVVTAQALEAADKAKAATLDLHKTHLEPHVEKHLPEVQVQLAEAQKQGEELYAKHVEPHVGPAWELYSKSVQPHVDTARSSLLSAYSAATEQAMATLSDLPGLGCVKDKLSALAADSRFQALEEMVSPKAVKIGQRTLRFPRGMLDIAAALFQLTLVAVVLFVVAWRLCLKTLFWRLGMKVFGKKAISMSFLAVKVCRWLLATVISLALTSLSWALGLANMVTCLGVMSAICTGFVYGVELSVLLGMGVSKGLTIPMRVAAGLAVALLWGLVVGPSTLCGCCGVCGRKKAKAKKAEANVKAKAKATSKPAADAKADAKAAAASGKKK